MHHAGIEIEIGIGRARWGAQLMIRGVGTAVAVAAAAAVVVEIASRRGRVRTGEGRAGQIMREGHLQIAQAAVELFLGGGLLGRSWAVAWHLAVLLRFYLLAYCCNQSQYLFMLCFPVRTWASTKNVFGYCLAALRVKVSARCADFVD